MRQADCLEEVRLNRRLAPDVYLGVVALVLGPDGLQLDGPGPPVDWLVRMRRLPREHTLEHALRTGTAQAADVARVASRLARFYATAPRVPAAPDEYRRRIETDLSDDRRWLCRPGLGLDVDGVCRTVGVLLDALDRHGEVIGGRGDRLIEGHGDLRPEHVFVAGMEPVVIDCLEFRRDFRIIDPVDELAFLGLECERLGGGWVGPLLLMGYEQFVDDRPTAPIVEFYTARRRCCGPSWRSGTCATAISARDHRGPTSRRRTCTSRPIIVTG